MSSTEDGSAGAIPSLDIAGLAIADLADALLGALDRLGFIGRHLHPPDLAELVLPVDQQEDTLRSALDRFRAVPRRDDMAAVTIPLEQAAEAALAAFVQLREAVLSGDLRQAFRGTRQTTRALEALYPAAATLPSVSRFFLEPAARGDASLMNRLAQQQPGAPGGTGVAHIRGAKGARGGYTRYVPETYDPAKPCPLAVVLHGGSGNGGAFVWSWLAGARSRGMILLSPTAIGDTWSLMEPELDGENIAGIVAEARAAWNVDASHMLLTGMSDGGTFSLLSGLSASSPFTHIAPIAASFHPLLLAFSDAGRMRGLPVYLVHGALDWMFPVSGARAAAEGLAAAGAVVTYREVADLSHTYPRDENPRILDWFLAASP